MRKVVMENQVSEGGGKEEREKKMKCEGVE